MCRSTTNTVPIPLKTKILIADDHAVVRDGLRGVLDAEADLHVVAEAADGADAVARGLQDDIDLAILDIAMPRRPGYRPRRSSAGSGLSCASSCSPCTTTSSTSSRR